MIFAGRYPIPLTLPKLFPQEVKRKVSISLETGRGLHSGPVQPQPPLAALAFPYRCRQTSQPAPSGQPGLETDLHSEDFGGNCPHQDLGTSSLGTTASRTWERQDAMEHVPSTVTPKGHFPSRWHHLEGLGYISFSLLCPPWGSSPHSPSPRL